MLLVTLTAEAVCTRKVSVDGYPSLIKLIGLPGAVRTRCMLRSLCEVCPSLRPDILATLEVFELMFLFGSS